MMTNRTTSKRSKTADKLLKTELFPYGFGVLFIFNLVDLLILDWLIVCWVKPHWVILPGTEHIAIPNPYVHHFKEFLMGTVGLGIIGLAIAALLSIKF